MAKGGNTGPNRGANQTCGTFIDAWRTSATDTPLFVHTFNQPGRILAIRLRTTGSGTGTLTAWKVRRAAAGATAVTAGGTQCLGADGGALAANATALTDPDGTASTSGQFLEAQRSFAVGEQIGIFGTTDGGTANGVEVCVVFFPRAHYRATDEVD